MSALHKLQQDFLKGIFENDTLVQNELVESPLSAEQRMNIYRNNSHLTLLDVLRETYPVTCRLVDTRFFDYAAHHFISTHPPHSGNLHEYGKDFAVFLAGFPPVQTLPYLPDVARLEWALHAAYHAPDAPDFPLQEFQQLAPEDYAAVRFTFHPSCHLLESGHPILSIWQANRDASKEPEAISLIHAPTWLLVHRRGAEVEALPLSESEYAFLLAILRGESFEHAFEIAKNIGEDFNLEQALVAHISRGSFCGFCTDE